MTETSQQPTPVRRRFRVALNVIAIAIVSAVIAVGVSAYNERLLNTRIRYAMGVTGPLRQKIEQFYVAERHWPNGQELGVPDWNPYPDGGGYQLLQNGTVKITFSVLAELKGQSITLSPKPTQDGRIIWECIADVSIRRFSPGCHQ